MKTKIAEFRCTTSNGVRDAEALLRGRLAPYNNPNFKITWSSKALRNSTSRDFTARVWKIAG